MKRRGFTLVELLAVIIVLAIIALISTPIVINMIERSKKGAAERSVENYIKAVDIQIMAEKSNGNIIEDGTYNIKENGNLCKVKSLLCTESEEIKIDMNGTRPNSGKVKIEDSKITAYKLTINNYETVLGNLSRLPDEYQEVEYIESTGTQYIDTKVRQSDFSNNLKGYVDFQFINLENNSIIGGCRNTNSSDYFFIFLADSDKFQSNLGKGSSLEIKVSNSDCNRHYFTFDSSLAMGNYDNTAFNYINSNANVPYNIYLFGYNDNNRGVLRKSFLRIYKFRLSTSDDILIRNFIPCYSTTIVTDVYGIERPKDTVGLYDTAEGKFYTNANTAKDAEDFEAGPEVY